MDCSIFEYKEEATLPCLKNYTQFLNWVSGEFDLFLQEETIGLYVYFPEGYFSIKNSKEKEKIIVHINLKTKVEKEGEDILKRIMSLYNLLLKIK
tara:strand:+ start:331 stop:615 length:285 start_codon:yes stop_codon:yes gene_type:complete